MSVESQLDFYANSSNEPLPCYLMSALNFSVARLEQQEQACHQHYRRIGESIEEKESTIRALESQIKRLRVIQARILTTEKSITQRKTRHSATVSPFRRVPPEVIAKIMAFRINSDYGNFVQAGGRKVFQNLRAVSRSWRQTALSTPSLWRRVGISGDDFPYHKWDDLTRSLTSWFSRGGASAPLSLFLNWVSLRQAMYILEYMFHSRLNFASAALAIELDIQQIQRHGLSILKFLLPSPGKKGGPTARSALKTLTVFFNGDQRGIPSEILDLSHAHPQLSILSISYSHAAGREATSFGHKNLTVLRLKRVHLPADKVEFVLAGLPQLAHLFLTECKPFRIDATGEDVEGVPYVHHSIHDIEFRSGIPLGFLSRLACPSLRTVRVCGDSVKGQEGELGLAMIQSFVRHCGVAAKVKYHDEAPRTLKP
jgi:F-box-like